MTPRRARRIWDLMEAEDYACQPRPVHHRIPNFVDADKAAARMGRLPEFKAAAMVKVNPDTPLTLTLAFTLTLTLTLTRSTRTRRSARCVASFSRRARCSSRRSR